MKDGKRFSSALIAGILFLAPGPAGAQTPTRHSAPVGTFPRRVLIPGVPFVSWNEAAGLEYENKNILNPSFEAVMRMALGYSAVAAPKGAKKSAITPIEGEATLQDLKRSLASGNPVVLYPALTPIVHPLDASTSVSFALGLVKGVKLPEPGPVSGLLGPMIPLEVATQIPDSLSGPLNESMSLAARIAIGYDDDRDVIVFHDPSFGPAWEMSSREFDRMWKAAGRKMWVVERRTSAALPSEKPAPYRARTPDELAAWSYVLGYSNAYVGNPAKAEALYCEGLALPGLSKGYRFLLLFELAVLHSETGRPDEAIPLALEATKLVPEVPAPWVMLAKTYPKSSRADRKKLAKEAEKRAKSLDQSPTGNAAIAEALPADFMLTALAEIRGWGGKSKVRR